MSQEPSQPDSGIQSEDLPGYSQCSHDQQSPVRPASGFASLSQSSPSAHACADANEPCVSDASQNSNTIIAEEKGDHATESQYGRQPVECPLSGTSANQQTILATRATSSAVTLANGMTVRQEILAMVPAPSSTTLTVRKTSSAESLARHPDSDASFGAATSASSCNGLAEPAAGLDGAGNRIAQPGDAVLRELAQLRLDKQRERQVHHCFHCPLPSKGLRMNIVLRLDKQHERQVHCYFHCPLPPTGWRMDIVCSISFTATRSRLQLPDAQHRPMGFHSVPLFNLPALAAEGTCLQDQ